MYIARAFAQQAQFFGAISQLSLPPQVVGRTPSLGTDWNGNEAVFFQVVLVDNAVPRSQLLDFTKQISSRSEIEWRPCLHFNDGTRKSAPTERKARTISSAVASALSGYAVLQMAGECESL